VYETVSIISPIDGSVVTERELATGEHIEAVLQASLKAQKQWQAMPVAERALLCHKAIDHMRDDATTIAGELTWLIGRPISHSPGEVHGLEQRARYMIDIAGQELADIRIDSSAGFTRFIRHQPLGTVLVLAPWNYPYLTAVNSVIPALMAGNCVILKHSAQTLLCAERFYSAFEYAGLPEGVFQYLHLNHAVTGHLVQDERIDFVSFTGSVAGGDAIERAAAGLFKGVALELGGKDPAYVMPDADLDHSVENLVDGAFFNAGQSCCGIERIYVHKYRYDIFVQRYVDKVMQYVLGNPLEKETTLGPMVNAKRAGFVRTQIDDAIRAGAAPLVDEKSFAASQAGTPYLAPQVLINVDHSMSVMRDESFGPVVGIMKVDDDAQAIALMNDSDYGLSASIWSRDEERAVDIGSQVNTGTVYMNRCDYLDPALAWVGVKKSGRGCSLSKLGYAQLTRPKSFHLKKAVHE